MPNWSDDEGRCVPCMQGECTFHKEARKRRPKKRPDACASLAKSLSDGPCSCYHINGSFAMSYDYKTGETKYEGSPGTLVQCLRCRAREALKADGVEHQPKDHVLYITRN